MDEDHDPEQSTGWAQVLQRLVYASEKRKKKPLSKALRDNVREKKKREEAEKDLEKDQLPKENVQAVKKSARKKPDFKEREYERMLQSIATKGVVQLFNAINEHKPPEDATETKEGARDEPINKFINQWGELKDEDEEAEASNV